MKTMALRMGIGRLSGAVVLAVVLLVAGATCVWSVRDAFEDRATAAAARDLQVAAMRVAAADAIRIAGGDPTVQGLDQAVDALAGDHAGALAALLPSEAASAEVLLVEIAGCGSWLLDPGTEVHEVHGHDELQLLLDKAATAAGDDATSAERDAAAALLAALVTSLVGSWLFSRSRRDLRRRHSDAVTEAQAAQRFVALVGDSPDVFIVIAPNGEMTYRSASSGRLLPADAGYLDDIVALAEIDAAEDLRAHLQRTDTGGASKVYRLTDANGITGCFELRVSDLTHDPAIRGHVVTVRDVTREHVLREELRSNAETDALTGIPNRRALTRTVDSMAEGMAMSGFGIGFVLLDIDAFRALNDSLGHETGDELLRLAAKRLRNALQSDAVLFRLGSDEFAAIILSEHIEGSALEVTGTLREVFGEPFQVAGRAEQLSVSVGFAVAEQPEDVGGLHRCAEIALLASKRSSYDTPVMYQPSLEETVARSTQIRRALYSAVYDDEFEVVYQPMVSAETSAIYGLEALLRWNSPTLGIVGPDEFIPIAEDAGDICAIGRWVTETVCRQLSVWTSFGMHEGVSMSFNVSARQLEEADFVHCVSTTARVWGVDPHRLVVEVTETAALDENGTAIGRLNELRAAGFRISIDDFGSGYSNLAQLLQVPFDVLKIDRSLLLMLTDMRASAGGDPTDPCQILQAIVSIAEILGVPVVCEGVETQEQRQSLTTSGITYIQGYLTGRPASAADTARLLELSQTATDRDIERVNRSGIEPLRPL